MAINLAEQLLKEGKVCNVRRKGKDEKEKAVYVERKDFFGVEEEIFLIQEKPYHVNSDIIIAKTNSSYCRFNLECKEISLDYGMIYSKINSRNEKYELAKKIITNAEQWRNE